MRETRAGHSHSGADLIICKMTPKIAIYDTCRIGNFGGAHGKADAVLRQPHLLAVFRLRNPRMQRVKLDLKRRELRALFGVSAM